MISAANFFQSLMSLMMLMWNKFSRRDVYFLQHENLFRIGCTRELFEYAQQAQLAFPFQGHVAGENSIGRLLTS